MVLSKTYILISQVEHDVVVTSRIANETTFEECDVENGRIEVDKLEDEYFECQIVIKLGLRAMHFYKNDVNRRI